MITTILLLVVFLALALFRLALSDILFSTCPEGQIKVITKSGKYYDFIHSVSGYKKVGRQLVPLAPGETEEDRSILNTGVYWVGLWPVFQIHEYKFEWETIVQDKIVSRREVVNSIIFRFEYPLVFKKMDTADNYEVTVVIQVMTEVFYPEKALFKARNWLNVVKAGVEAKVRDFVSKLSYEEFRAKPTEVSGDINGFVECIIKLSTTDNTDSNPGFEDTVGMRIVAANLRSIDAAPEIMARLQLVADAKRKGDADVALAERETRAKITRSKGDKKARILEAEGEKIYIDKTTLHVASNPAAAKIAAIGALPKSITTLVQEGAIDINLGGKKND